jgi:hypothetical protein
MKIVKPLLSAVFLLSMIILIAGCAKSTENKLHGRWARVPVENMDQVFPWEQWEFESGGVYKYHYSANGSDTLTVSGTFKVESFRDFKIFAYAEDGIPDQYPGNWRIIKLKKDRLIIVKEEAGLTFKEFTKM